MEEPPIPPGYCADCGYYLRGLTLEYRCPECGRKFDPNDPKTFRTNPHSRLMNWLARPIGCPTVILSLIAAAGVLAVTRWKWNTFNPSAVDLVYYLNPSALLHRTNLVTDRDVIYTGSMLLAILVALWWVLWLTVGTIVRWQMDWRYEDRPARAARRHVLVVLALLLVATGAALGWPYRLAQQWIAREKVFVRSPQAWITPALPSNILSPPQKLLTLRAAVIQMPKPEQRIAGLKILIEVNPTLALPILTEAVGLESDSQVRALELCLIGLHRDRSTVPLLGSFLSDPDPTVRAAAIDAIGLVHAPAFDVPFIAELPMENPGGAIIDSIPPIHCYGLPQFGRNDELPMDAIEVDSSVRHILEHMMLAGATTGEREAAARALLRWPPDAYKLRVAEWGLWADEDDHLKLIQSVSDEVPSFVHRTGNPADDLQGGISPTGLVARPAVFITVDKPMALDVKVMLEEGRAWFTYPQADDVAVNLKDSTKLPAYIRLGYPWLQPLHSDQRDINDGYFSASIIGVLRWQSIIVSPSRLPWMTLSDTTNDPHIGWWKRLRNTKSSWISSCGESENFIYYDGPTLGAAPINASLRKNVLRLTHNTEMRHYYWAPNQGEAHPPQSILLMHRHNGQLSGQVVAYQPTDISLPADDLHDNAVIDAFRKMLRDAGLTADEAEGLVAAWTPQFFNTDGTRTLIIMDRRDYDTLCPMQIRPTPTEWARVGIVLKEFK